MTAQARAGCKSRAGSKAQNPGLLEPTNPRPVPSDNVVTWVKQINADNFRSLARAQLQLEPGTNLLLGDNGAGKTSFIEALTLCARGCGPKPRLRELCGTDKNSWAVRALVQEEDKQLPRQHRLVYLNERVDQQIDGVAAGSDELARSLPMGVLVPAQHGIINDGAAARLRWIDWCMFHVEHQFLQTWRTWRRALKQRNAALRAKVGEVELKVWTAEYARAGVRVDAQRRSLVEKISNILVYELSALLGEGDWQAAYFSGWDESKTLNQALEEGLDSDRRAGTTRRGPHRADLGFKHEHYTMRRHASRGEEKLAAIALMLAMARYMIEARQILPVLVLDDFPAELSVTTQERVLQRLVDTGAQVILSAHEACGGAALNSAAMFHVEHGTITRQA